MYSFSVPIIPYSFALSNKLFIKKKHPKEGPVDLLSGMHGTKKGPLDRVLIYIIRYFVIPHLFWLQGLPEPYAPRIHHCPLWK